jgi:hypothetical protein
MKRFFLSLVVAGLALSGCAGNKGAVKKDNNDRPDWADKGGIFKDEDGTVVYGVGIADKGPNASLKREKADSRARADLATQLKVVVKRLTLDYMSDHKDYFDEKNTAGSDETTTVVTKSVVDQTLIGSKIVDRWTDPETGAQYSLARMQVGDPLYDSYQAALRRSLKAQHRLETEQRMKDALGELDKEIADQRENEARILGATKRAPEID